MSDENYFEKIRTIKFQRLASREQLSDALNHCATMLATERAQWQSERDAREKGKQKLIKRVEKLERELEVNGEGE